MTPIPVLTRRFCSVMLLSLAGALFPTGPGADAGEIRWLPPSAYEAARAAAGKQGQLVFVYVRGENCPYCDMFADNHLSDPAFQLWINTLFQPILVNQDHPADAALLKQQRWPGKGVPRFYIVDAAGKLVGRETGAAFFPPMKACDIFTELAKTPVPFRPEALRNLATTLRGVKAPPQEMGRALVYAAMEAMAWYWAGDMTMARRAFGAKFEPFLLNGPVQAPPAQRAAWDEIRLWYIRFWYDWAGDGFNFESVARVAESGSVPGGNALYPRYAALILGKLNRWNEAKPHADLYDKAPESKDDREFKQFRTALGKNRR